MWVRENMRTLTAGLRALFAMGIVVASGFAAETPLWQEIIKASGVEAGLCVHVGTTDGVLEAGLTNGTRIDRRSPRDAPAWPGSATRGKRRSRCKPAT